MCIIRKQQIWVAMCSDPAGCDSLPYPHPYASTPLVVSTGGDMTAADVQLRHEWSHLLCLAASTNSTHPLFTASICSTHTHTRRYIYSSWQRRYGRNTAVLFEHLESSCEVNSLPRRGYCRNRPSCYSCVHETANVSSLQATEF